jgi:serine/threonine protein kinase
MEEIDKLEHFTISRRRDGSLWELGRGAMGVTYKALDTNLQSEVALKVISAQYLGSEPARQRFLREARAAASLRHPNVATVFHLGKVDGLIYYAMEYVNGETVERRVQREGPMHPLLALRIVRQVTGALVAADLEKLVHRDIKPSNIMLALEQGDDQLLVKVIDFGLAKSFISSASPIFLTRESYGRAKREAFRQFDAQWNAKRDDLRRQRDWLSYQINHSTGTAQEKLKAQMEQVKGQIDQLDGQRRSARKVLRQSWEGLRTGQ